MAVRRKGTDSLAGSTGYKEEVFYSEGCEALAQVTQRGGGSPTLRDAQRQAEWGSEYLIEL